MTAADKTKLGFTNIAYATCSTEAATAAKVITISGNTNWTLAVGSIIVVKFSVTNTAQNPTFNVNSSGAKSVWYNTGVITTGSLGMAGSANRPMQFMYDGTNWIFLGWSLDNNTTYSQASLGQGYGTCTTAEATTAKAVTLSSYSLHTGGIVAVKFSYAVPAGATMNINSKGAKAIYYKGAAITAGVIPAGAVATFVYNGSQYHLLAIDTLNGPSGVTAGSYGPTAAVTGTEGATINVPQITVDAYGRVTSVTNRTYTSKNSTYSSLKNPNAIAIKYNGTQSYTYDGSAAKTLNIKAGNNVTVTGDTSGNITIAAKDTTYSEATTSSAGLMSAADKTKVSNLETLKQDRNLYFNNVTASSWTADTTYADFGYVCNLSCSGVTANMYAEVVFDVAQATSGNYAPVCETGSGIVKIWSSTNTSITVPVIIVHK